MTIRIGPTRCGECGNDYGHYAECSKSKERPENWPISRKIEQLEKLTTATDADRLTVLINLTAQLARKVERDRGF